MPGLGRRLDIDPRDKNYEMRRGVSLLAVPLPQTKSWRIGGASLDQGNTSTCVGYAWRNFIRCAPLQSERGAKPFDIYRKAVLMDSWADNDAEATLADSGLDKTLGTSVRAGAKALQALQHLSTYVWAFDLQTALEWVLASGPAVLGTNWYASMDTPDKDGIARISANSSMVGGHAYLMRGVNQRKELVLCENSWGEEWGIDGRFYLTFTDLERLIKEDGECCAADENWIKP